MPRILPLLLSLFGLHANARWLTKAESGSVVDTFNADLVVKRNGASELTVEYGVRVQSEDAKTSAGRFAIDYNSATDKVEVLEAFTKNDKVKIPVDPAAIEDRDQGESKDYDALKVRSLVFPQVQIGSRLFVRYRIVTEKPLIKDRWSDRFSLWPTGAVEKLRYRVTSELPLYVETSDPQKYLKVKQTDPAHVEIINARFVPAGVQAEKDPYWHPARISEVWISTEREWPKFFGSLNDEYQRVLAAELPKPLEKWISAARRLKSPEEKAYALMKYMSENLRYFGDWRRHDGGLIPRSLAEIEHSRYGDCKDLASLLTAMLRRLNLKADVALIRRGDNPWGHEPDYQLPNVGHFNHAIARFEVAPGRVWWLDATNPVASMRPLADISGRPTLVLAADGPRLDRLPDAAPADFKQTTDFTYRFGKDGGAKVTVQSSFEELGASRLANSLMLAPRAQVLSEVLDYFSEGHEINSHRYTSEPQTGRRLTPMTVGLEYDADKVTYTAGRDAFFVLPDSFLNGPFFETVDRESDLKLNEMPYASHTVRRLKDTRLAQPVPPACVIDSPWFTVRREVLGEARDVVVVQDVELKKAFLTRDELRSDGFKRAQADTRVCFSHAGVLVAPR